MITVGRTYRIAAVVSLGVAGVLVLFAVTDVGTAFPSVQRIDVATSTCGALVLCIAAVLIFNRYHANFGTDATGMVPAPARLSDVVLAPAIGLVAATLVVFSAVPAVVSTEPASFAVWAQLLGQTIGVAAVALGAWIPADRVVRRRVTAGQTVGAVLGGLVVIALLAVAASRFGPPPGRMPPTMHTDWLPAEVVLIALMALAFVAFARRADREDDRLMRGLAVAVPLASGAVIALALGPKLGADWPVADELLALAAYGAIFAGAWTESAAYWRRLVALAGAEERRRIARDLHDGMAQDLMYIVMQSRSLAERYPDVPALDRVVHASERALDESRGTIGALSYPPSEPLAHVLDRCVEDVAARERVAMSVHVDDGLELSLGVRDTLLRIAREATWNAVRHGRATRVDVAVHAGAVLALTVRDDGVGFDTTASRSDAGRGFGIEAMRERARAAGGVLVIRSAPGEGTEVSATLPYDRARLVLTS